MNSSNYSENNHLTLKGKVVTEKKVSHEIYGETFYIFNLEVVRLSTSTDIIPITVSERLITDLELTIGKEVYVEGQFRSYNNYENEKNKLILTVFAKEIRETSEEDAEASSNEVELVGYVCKKPIYRQTPFGREIADLLLAVNRAYNKSDYIPTIAWGRNARFCQNLEVGAQVKIIGRVQSRQYEKKYEDGTSEIKVAYEVSICSLELINEEAPEKKEEETENQEAV